MTQFQAESFFPLFKGLHPIIKIGKDDGWCSISIDHYGGRIELDDVSLASSIVNDIKLGLYSGTKLSREEFLSRKNTLLVA